MKKILSLFLCLVMLTSFFATGVQASQTPLAPPDDWALEFVQKAHDLCITDSGVAYNYRGAINREEFCNLVHNFIVNVINAPIPKANNNFSDTSSPQVNILCDLGIIKGKSNGVFAVSFER